MSFDSDRQRRWWWANLEDGVPGEPQDPAIRSKRGVSAMLQRVRLQQEIDSGSDASSPPVSDRRVAASLLDGKNTYQHTQGGEVIGTGGPLNYKDGAFFADRGLMQQVLRDVKRPGAKLEPMGRNAGLFRIVADGDVFGPMGWSPKK
jgi:hypothetical protein